MSVKLTSNCVCVCVKKRFLIVECFAFNRSTKIMQALSDKVRIDAIVNLIRAQRRLTASHVARNFRRKCVRVSVGVSAASSGADNMRPDELQLPPS